MPRVDSAGIQGAGSFVELRPLTWGEAKQPALDVEPLLLARILDWNWTDAHGAPLPVPRCPADLDALTVDEIDWLARAITVDSAAVRAKADALLTALWTGSTKAQPVEYVEYVLCTKVYRCTPGALAEQPLAAVELHLAFWNAEQKHRQAEQKAAQERRRKG